MIRSWIVPPVRRAMHWTSSGSSTTSFHAHTSYLYQQHFAFFLLLQLKCDVPSSDQISVCFQWHCGGRISGSQWLTLTTSEQPIHMESVGLLIYSWSLKMAKIFSPSFLLVLHLSYFLGIFGIFHPKWLKYYKDTFISLHM